MPKAQKLHTGSFDPALARTTASVGLDPVGLDTVSLGVVGLGVVGVIIEVECALQLVVNVEDGTCAKWPDLEGGMAVVTTTRFTDVVEEQVTVLNSTRGTVAVCEAQLMVVQGARGTDVGTPTVATTIRVLGVILGPAVVLGTGSEEVQVVAMSTIAGFSGTKGAQMPAKKARAESSSFLELLQARMHPLTLFVNSVDGQKHAASLLESHFGIVSHVLRHLGTTLGQGAVTTGGLGPVVVMTVVVMIELVIGGCECTTRGEVVLGSVSAGLDGHTVVDNGYVEVTKTVE